MTAGYEDLVLENVYNDLREQTSMDKEGTTKSSQTYSYRRIEKVVVG
jgi:hypothetical protein